MLPKVNAIQMLQVLHAFPSLQPHNSTEIKQHLARMRERLPRSGGRIQLSAPNLLIQVVA